jgi:uncharacterized protein (DUF2062 family)
MILPARCIQLVFKRVYERLIKIRGRPPEIALGFALGIFVGMSPFMGFQTALAIFIASLLKWNKIAAAIGVWVSNPFTAPFLYGVTYYVGAGILGEGGSAPFCGGVGASAFLDTLAKAPDILWAMTLGGVILGIPLSMAAYFFVHSAVQKYQAEIRGKLARQKALLAKKRGRRKKERKQAKKS